MRVQSAALATVMLAGSSIYGNAFASSSISFNSNRDSAKAFIHRPSSAPSFTSTLRGGAATSRPNDISSSLSATREETEITESVANHISMENWELLSERGRQALQSLIEGDKEFSAQKHVYADWPEAGTDDEGKIRLTEQLADLDASYPGGLAAYITKARALLKESADGTNPFTDYSASIPTGESLSYDSPTSDSDTGMTFAEAEQQGLTGIADVAFVLVAGGLGERLGYSGIKLSLETNLVTNKSYLEIYVKYILAMQHMAEVKTGRTDVNIPLVIMTSGDTDPLTRKLLEDNNNFGMKDGQIQIVCQDKVAALKDSAAGLSLDKNNRWEVETKPHGHGDVHHLLVREGHVDKWEKEGRKHVIFLQDTNALVINSILPTLGVSIEKNFDMNSICIPRLAGEAAGAITKLEHKTDPNKSLVINVEYNQLDPLLKTQGDCKGDVADETGYSPYPGNANNIVIGMDAYAKTLRGEDQGVVVEFVNPKYKDAERKEFKKATRLECMMQDIPKLFQKELGSDANIGFTTFDRWFTFSPAKNSLESGIDAVNGGNTAPGTMSSAESDKYIQNQRKLKHAGMEIDVTEQEDLINVGGIPVTPGPRVIICPGFAITQEEVVNKIHGGSITKSSTLVLEGQGLTVKNLKLDGALIIRCQPGCEVEVDGLEVQNKGYGLKEIPDNADVEEVVSIRGYTMEKEEAHEIIITDPGKYFIGKDGVVKKID